MFYLLTAVFLMGCRPFLDHMAVPRRATVLRCFALVAGVVTILLFIGFNLQSVRCFMLDIDEANILSIAAASLHGQPVYHPVHALDVSYTYMYGPITFLVYRLLLHLGHGAFWPFRLLLVAANLTSCAVLFSIVKKFVRWQTALAVLALALCLQLQYVYVGFGLRSDAWILLATSLAVRCALMDAEWPAILLSGVFAGMAMDFKLTVAAALLPLGLILYRRLGIRAAVLGTLVALGTAPFPFLMPCFSLRNYLSWVLFSGAAGPDPYMVPGCFLYAVFLALPLLTLRAFGFDPWPMPAAAAALNRPGSFLWLEPAALGLCLLVAAYVSSKIGAGSYHFWYLLPFLLAYLGAAISRGHTLDSVNLRLDYIVCLIALSSGLFALSFASRDRQRLPPRSAEINQQLHLGRQEIQQDMERYHSRTLQVGYGDGKDNPVALLRYLPILQGQPYTLDGSGRIETARLPFPEGFLRTLATCRNDVWLIPHHERPFDNNFFPQILHDTFVAHYTVQQQGQVFDAWVCDASH
jgi:hypothetical protein